MVRALFLDFIERYMEFTEALLAWHADWQLRRGRSRKICSSRFERVVDEWEIAIGREGEEATERRRTTPAAARKFIKILRGVDDRRSRARARHQRRGTATSTPISKMVEREEKKRSANAVSRPDLNRIMHEMWRSIEARVPDDETKKADP
jgi:hypothetical protein